MALLLATLLRIVNTASDRGWKWIDASSETTSGGTERRFVLNTVKAIIRLKNFSRQPEHPSYPKSIQEHENINA